MSTSSQSSGTRPPLGPHVAAWLAWAFFPLLAIAIFLAYGSVGFNPTDDGWILDQSWRILHGARPHVDIVSVRLLGSAIVHTVDFLLPMPPLIGSRLVAASEVVAYSALFARLVYLRRVGRWSAAHYAGVVIAVVLDLHVFPLMAWSTIDGLVATGAALVLLAETGPGVSIRRVAIAGLLLGSAVLFKPSFLPGPLLALLLLLPALRRSGVRRARELVSIGALCFTLPIAAYVAWTASGGGLALMLNQLTHVVSVNLLYPLRILSLGTGAGRLAWVLDLTVVFLAVALMGTGAGATSPPRARGQRSRVIVAGGLILAVAGVTVATGGLRGDDGIWADQLLTMVLVADLVMLVQRRLAINDVVVLAAAYSIGLSGGYANPALMAGVLLLALLRPVFEEMGTVLVSSARARGSVALVAAAAVVALGWGARSANPYYDLPRDRLKVDLGQAMPRLAGVRTNPSTARFMSDIAACHTAYPSHRLAVVPDAAVAPMALDVQPALPISWVAPVETNGSESYLLQAARRLDAEGDYLVLFETFNPQLLAFFSTPPSAGPGSRIFAGQAGLSASQAPGPGYRPSPATRLAAQLEAALQGGRHYCGSFIAVYRR